MNVKALTRIPYTGSMVSQTHVLLNGDLKSQVLVIHLMRLMAMKATHTWTMRSLPLNNIMSDTLRLMFQSKTVPFTTNSTVTYFMHR